MKNKVITTQLAQRAPPPRGRSGKPNTTDRSLRTKDFFGYFLG